MMLLNLDKLRKDDLVEKLINYRTTGINDYMDQDTFNVVFDQNVIFLSPIYNMILSGWRKPESTLEVLNSYYGLQFTKKTEYYEKSVILHLSSADKPWIYTNVIGSEEWMMYYIHSPFKKQFNCRTQKRNAAWQLELINEIDYESIKRFTNTSNVPKVSVVTPVYNASEYLVECIDSLLKQSFSETEYIFVDDGSKDDSLAILKRYATIDPRIIVLTQTNQHAGVARNNGISKCSGDYITFLDSDDILDKEAIKKMYAAATETDADIVISGAATFSNNYLEAKPAYWCLRTEYLPKVTKFSKEEIPVLPVIREVIR